jgi:hypothetical protein
MTGDDCNSGFNLTLSTMPKDAAELYFNTTYSVPSSREQNLGRALLPSMGSRHEYTGSEPSEHQLPWRSQDAKPQPTEAEMAASLKTILQDKPFVIITDKGQKVSYG